MNETIKDFILSVGANDSSASMDLFNNIVRNKVASAIEDRKRVVGSTMFQPPEED